MSSRFVNIDHDTPLLLPPDLPDWVPPGHMVHFIVDAVKALDLSLAHTNERGTGSAQYPPSMMLGRLIYCYATGTFAARQANDKQLYGLRKQTVGPVFGIVKEAIGFRRFPLRGQQKVELEWTLTTTPS